MGPLAHQILEFKPDIVHIQHAYGFFYNIPEFVALLKLLKNENIVITFHEIPTYEHQLWYGEVPATFIFPHKASLEYAQNKFGFNGKHIIIPHGATLFEAIPKELARQKLNLPQNRLILSQIGFFSYGKGMKELVEATSLIKDLNPLLVFAGSVHPMAIDEDRRFLKKTMATIVELKLQQNVIFTGKHLSEEEINLWVSAADLIVLNHQLVYPAISSSSIGKRIIASGKPCLFGDDPRLSEFEDGKICLKVKSNDPSDIAVKIRRLINDKALQESLGENAKIFAFNNRWAEIGEKHLELYQQIYAENTRATAAKIS